MSGAISILVAIRSSLFLLTNWKATKKLHQNMLASTLNAPVNLYFDVTPLGRILNKFSKDLSQIESSFGFLFGSFF